MQRRDFLKQIGGSTAALAHNWSTAATPAGGSANGSPAAGGASFTCTKLRCEYRSNPLGVGVRQPRISWILTPAHDTVRGLRQSAYQILAAGTVANLENDHGDLWDSGKIGSDETLHIPYQGQPLKSKQYCHWKVRAWDAGDRVSPWSDVAYWSMGLLERTDWQAHWIADRESLGRESSLCYRGGYQSETATSADTEKWVMLDLGRIENIDSVKLFPAACQNWDYAPGFLFPCASKSKWRTSLIFPSPRWWWTSASRTFPIPGHYPKPIDLRRFPPATCA